MREHQKHIEAFEYLMAMGGGATDANFRKIAEKFQITERTAWNWYGDLGWKERLELRNIENAKKLAQKTDSTIINEKANCRKDIVAFVNILKYSVNIIIEQIKRESKKPLDKRDSVFQVQGIQDFDKLIKGYDTLQKLNFLVLGEPTENVNVTDTTDTEVLRRLVGVLESNGTGGDSEFIDRIKQRIQKDVPK